MKITEELVDYISRLSRLQLPREEKTAMAAQLEDIVAYMDVLNRLDTSGQEPEGRGLPLERAARPDRTAPSQAREELLANGPAVRDGAFLVPRTVE